MLYDIKHVLILRKINISHNITSKKFRVKKYDTDTVLLIAKVLLVQTEYHTSESQSRVTAYPEANNRT